MNLDAEVSKYTGDGGVVSKEEIERRITENVLGDYKKYGYGRLAVELKEENKFIGFTGLKYLDDMDEVDPESNTKLKMHHPALVPIEERR